MDAPGNVDGPRRRVKVYPEIENRKRAKKPKVKTGCRTCKTRRVKCDEGKPTCKKCLAYGAVCDGYKAASSSLAPNMHSRPILPKEELTRYTQSPRRNSISLLGISEVPNTPLCSDSTSHNYFLHFLSSTTTSLSGSCPDALFFRIIPQVCTQEPSLLALTISLGAISKAKSLPSPAGTPHLSFALTKYGKALASIQKAINTRGDQDATRIALISSLLIFCFENLHGDHKRAIMHMEAALKLMCKKLQTHSKNFSKIKNKSEIPNMEYDLLCAFVRVDNTLMSRMECISDAAAQRVQLLGIQYPSEDAENMPARFRDVSEARNYMEHFQFQAMSELKKFTSVLENQAGEVVVERNVLMMLNAHLDAWYRAFDPLFFEADAYTWPAAATMKALALATDLCIKKSVAEALAKPGEAKPTRVEESMEILELCRGVVGDPGFYKGDRGVREGVVEVLRRADGRREMVWEARMVRRLGEGMLGGC
ncbi:hypothetical protein G7Y89_g3539 [Cudoniella acicularis]|uniref:Zn(2)-C6 fungal-type domain-containing protein n=1 Tax=Cudoniella acicularis TaxID=354080 RepID=A0A8H4RT96_9HELO|nr:hypothetical protein G7Y89_g3539 [Cudoniella acicularis]